MQCMPFLKQVSLYIHKDLLIAGSGADSADTLADLKTVNIAISGHQMENTMLRNTLLAQQLQTSLDSKSMSSIPETSRKFKVRTSAQADLKSQF